MRFDAPELGASKQPNNANNGSLRFSSSWVRKRLRSLRFHVPGSKILTQVPYTNSNIVDLHKLSLLQSSGALSRFRHRCKLRSGKKPPHIPSFRVLEDEDVEVEEEDDEDDVRKTRN